MDALNVEVLAVITVIVWRLLRYVLSSDGRVLRNGSLAATFPAGWTLIRIGVWSVSTVPALLTSIPGFSRLTVSFISTCCSVCSSLFTASCALFCVSLIRFYHLDLGRLTCHFLKLALRAFICPCNVECSR